MADTIKSSTTAYITYEENVTGTLDDFVLVIPCVNPTEMTTANVNALITAADNFFLNSQGMEVSAASGFIVTGAYYEDKTQTYLDIT